MVGNSHRDEMAEVPTGQTLGFCRTSPFTYRVYTWLWVSLLKRRS